MKLQLVPARQGVLWVRHGFQVFFRQPVAFAGMFAAFLFAIFVFTLVPLLGSILLLAALPLATLGFMIATRASVEGRFPLPRAFVEPLRQGRPRAMAMLKLGLVYAATTFAIMWLSDVVDGGALDALMETLSSGKTTPEAVAQKLGDGRLEAGLLLRLGLATLLSVPFWHAPALVHWDGQPWGKALFFSTVACWRNRGAFTVYGLTWMAVISLFAIMANLLFALLGQMKLIAFAAMPASLIFSTVFYASLYFTFADCFAADDPGESTGGPESSDTARLISDITHTDKETP